MIAVDSQSCPAVRIQGTVECESMRDMSHHRHMVSLSTRGSSALETRNTIRAPQAHTAAFCSSGGSCALMLTASDSSCQESLSGTKVLTICKGKLKLLSGALFPVRGIRLAWLTIADPSRLRLGGCFPEIPYIWAVVQTVQVKTCFRGTTILLHNLFTVICSRAQNIMRDNGFLTGDT